MLQPTNSGNSATAYWIGSWNSVVKHIIQYLNILYLGVWITNSLKPKVAKFQLHSA